MNAPLLGGEPCGIRVLSALKAILARPLRIRTHAFGVCHQGFGYSAQRCRRLSHAGKITQLGQG
jgi:hypothetical protein